MERSRSQSPERYASRISVLAALILYVSSIEPHLAEVSNLNFPEFKRAGQNNDASDAKRQALDSESRPFSHRQTLTQLADAGRINFENQGISVFHDSSLDPDRLTHV